MAQHNQFAHSRQFHIGFSVVELAVVISIIGILTTMVAVTYSITQKQSRDAKRNSDMTVFHSELEKFYDKHGEYPPGCSLSSCTNSLLTGNASTTVDFTTTTTTATIKSVLPGVPIEFGDPKFAGQPPFGAGSSVNKKYFYYGGTANYTTTTTNYTQNTPAPVCGINSSLLAGQIGSYVAGYFNEESNKWVLKGGRNGKAMTIVSGNASDGCVINK